MTFAQPGLANSDLLLRMFHSHRPVAHVPQEPHPRGSLGASPHEAIASRIGWNVLFENPTLGQLASHLIRYVAGVEVCPIALLDLKANIDTMVAIHSNLGGAGKVLSSSRRVVDQFNTSRIYLRPC
ncbi:hypothetical protein L210DRAFT_239850 [Boletus edulis BED1]|uniref:Uncharacterized protein n=1 Tax=Boletus edulis BED1 TaxID=1328754 RepID=A0AAD4BSN0_BOLED|nr:hypothetical protein L210DRAFT_239850 [Boletus edulis BED1]